MNFHKEQKNAMKRESIRRCVLFDWGDTLMRTFPEHKGPMATWPQVESVPGARETLKMLYPTWLIGLATNAQDSDEAEIRAALSRVGLNGWVDQIFSFRMIGARKPAIEFYAYILKAVDLPASSVAMVGDDLEMDVLGAGQAGLAAIWFNPRYLKDARGERVMAVQSLLDLPEVLERLVGKASYETRGID